ncbi:MAG: ATP-binding protein [Ilumatobacteraceae bacterium]
MDAHGAGGVSGALEIRAAADASELSGVRHRIRQFVEGEGGGAALAADLELVVSELATNVIEHTASTTLTVSISRTTDDWVVEVADVADLGILDHVVLPDQTQASGRGLFVVESIVDAIAIVENGDSYAIRCRIGA